MRFPCLLLCCLLLAACRDQVAKADLNGLNGYWEIKKVEAPGSEAREYGLNPAIDYIQVKHLAGYRKKLHPQADGSFLTSDDAVFFRITEQDGHFVLVSQGNGDQWAERLLYLEPNAFGLLSAGQVAYHYQRYQNPATGYEPKERK